MRIDKAAGDAARWGLFPAVLMLAWLATPGGYWPAAYPDAMGWLACGARSAWLLLAPWWALWAVALSVRWGAERVLPLLALGAAATPALLAWWPAGALNGCCRFWRWGQRQRQRCWLGGRLGRWR